MSIIWADTEKSLLEIVRTTMSTREIVKLFQHLNYDRSADAIQKMSKKMNLTFKDFGEPAISDLSKEEELAVYQILKERTYYFSSVDIPETKTSTIKSKETKDRREVLASLIDELRDIREQIPRIGSLSTHKQYTPDKQSMVLFLSDWHVCQQILDTDTQQPIYNKEVALERIEATQQHIRDTLSLFPVDTFDELVILLGGDIISGEGIFPGHDMSLKENAVEQVSLTVRAIWALIQDARVLFNTVRIITTKGNHGRSGISSPESNWDNMLYQILEILVDLEATHNLTIKNRYGSYNTMDIRGWRGLIRHTAPAQADTAAGIAKFASWQIMHQYDFMCFGHLHHWGILTCMGKPIFRNGSLMGGDDFAETLAKYDEPIQLLWGVSDQDICTFIKPLRYK